LRRAAKVDSNQKEIVAALIINLMGVRFLKQCFVSLKHGKNLQQMWCFKIN